MSNRDPWCDNAVVVGTSTNATSTFCEVVPDASFAAWVERNRWNRLSNDFAEKCARAMRRGAKPGTVETFAWAADLFASLSRNAQLKNSHGAPS